MRLFNTKVQGNLSLVAFFLIIGFGLKAQLTTQYDTPANLINNVLVGNGLNVSNISSQGLPLQFGRFNGANSNLGISSGVVIATCDINPPNGLSAGNFLTGANTPGDPLLSQLANGSVTNNAGIIQFDFVPGGDTLEFDYVFASAEYNFYVNSTFNDVFGFFLTGPKPGGGQYINENIALIPGTNLPVTINNVNNGQSGGCAFGPCNNCQYFVDNCNPTTVAFGGFTTPLKAKAAVIPCTTYTLRMGVADVIDGALNSAVFLKANSFNAGLVSISSQIDFNNTGGFSNDTVLYEGCSDATLKFIRAGESTQNDTVFFNSSGTATQGADFPAFPNYVIFPPGIDTVFLSITPFFDGIPEPDETLTITIMDTICNVPVMSTVTLVIKDVSPLSLTASDTSICRGQVVPLAYSNTGGSGFFNTTWTLNGTALATPYVVQPPVSRDYIISIYDECLDTTAVDTMSIKVYPKPNVKIDDLSICSDIPVTLNPSQVLAGFGYTWTPDSNLNNGSIPTPEFLYGHNGPGNQVLVIRMAVDSAGVVCTRDSLRITVFPRPDVLLDGDTVAICENSDVTLDAGAGFLNYAWQNGPSTQTYTVDQPGWYYVEVTDPNNCKGLDSTFADAQFLPVFDVADQEVCTGDTAILTVTDTLGNVLWWNGVTDTINFVWWDTTITLSITNLCGSTEDQVKISLIEGIPPFELPNILYRGATANADNAFYYIAAMETAEQFLLTIYNRWGVSVFQTNDLSSRWDGNTPGGAPVAPGTYFAVLSYVDCQGNEGKVSGTVTVMD
jgi:hypothetical protein